MRNRILHLSDIHFGMHAFAQPGTPPGPAWQTTFSESVIGALEGKKAGVHAIVVSGDITQKADTREFQLAARSLSQIVQGLGLETDKLVVTPGNHDVDWQASKSGAPERRFDNYRTFLGLLYGTALAEKLYGDAPGAFTAVHRINDWLSIGSVSSVRFETHQDHYGYVGRDELLRLEALLRKSDSFWKVVTLHHHLLPTPLENMPADPDGGANTSLDISIIRDSGSVLRTLGRAGVRLVLHGHKHDPGWRHHAFLENESSRGVTLLGAGSSGVHPQELPPTLSHHFQLVDFGETTVPVVTEYTCRAGRWSKQSPRALTSAYDEIASLEAKLLDKKNGKQSLHEVVKNAARRSPGWFEHEHDKLIENLCEEVNEARATDAVYWLVVFGVLELDDISQWFDGAGKSIEDVEPYIHLAERGRVLLERLATT